MAASGDVKSDKEGKSGVPVLPSEASWTGLILCESACGGRDCVTPLATEWQQVPGAGSVKHPPTDGPTGNDSTVTLIHRI